MVGNSNDETNFPYKLLLTGKEVERRRKAFSKHSFANIE